MSDVNEEGRFLNEQGKTRSFRLKKLEEDKDKGILRKQREYTRRGKNWKENWEGGMSHKKRTRLCNNKNRRDKKTEKDI